MQATYTKISEGNYLAHTDYYIFSIRNVGAYWVYTILDKNTNREIPGNRFKNTLEQVKAVIAEL